jgi:hypothetical protein
VKSTKDLISCFCGRCLSCPPPHLPKYLHVGTIQSQYVYWQGSRALVLVRHQASSLSRWCGQSYRTSPRAPEISGSLKNTWLRSLQRLRKAVDDGITVADILYMDLAGVRYVSTGADCIEGSSPPLATCRVQMAGKDVEHTRCLCRARDKRRFVLVYSSQCMIYVCYNHITGMAVTSCVLSSPTPLET